MYSLIFHRFILKIATDARIKPKEIRALPALTYYALLHQKSVIMMVTKVNIFFKIPLFIAIKKNNSG
jgi:hypothetical protein